MKFSCLSVALLAAGTHAFAPYAISRTGRSVFLSNGMIHGPPLSSASMTMKASDQRGTKTRDRGTRVISKASVPALSRWSHNSDGTVTGRISNSPDFRNNEEITTSRIKDKYPTSGLVVTTVSGSKYILVGRGSVQKDPAPKISSGGTVAVRNVPQDPPKGSMFFASPKGVPIMNQWRQNADGSITGRISGSPNFSERESVTTSPIKGTPSGNTVVTTISGSNYYLEGSGTVLTRLPGQSSGTRALATDNEGEDSNVSIMIHY